MDIEYLLWLQGIRETAGPFIESLMNAFSHICDGALIAIVPCLLYWVVDKRAGLFVMANLAIGGNINQTVKDTACVYRPWIRDARIIPSEEAIVHATGYSFPSGHTQSAATTFGPIAWCFREKRWVVVLCTALTLLIGFSRNFLGVHAPQDVAFALIESAIVLWVATHLFRQVDSGYIKDGAILVAGIVCVAILLLYTELKAYPMDYVDGELLVDPTKMKLDAYSQAGILLGIVAGWYLEKRYVGFTTDCSTKQKLVRLLVCVLMMGLFIGLGQFIKFVLGRGIIYAWVKGLFPAFIGSFVGPAVSAPLERRFAPSDTESPRESR